MRFAVNFKEIDKRIPASFRSTDKRFEAAFKGIQVVTKRADDEITPDMVASAGITGDIELFAESIVGYAFTGYKGITSLSAPNVKTVGTYSFYNTPLMKSVYLPLCTTINTYAFYAAGITELVLPECTSIANNAFQKATSITRLELPKCKTIGNSCFSNILITELILPECTSIGNSSLAGLSNCTYADLPKCTHLVNYALRNSGKLATLILRSETMCTLSNYALNATAIWKGSGHVYVPKALIESYQTATNWAKIYAANADTFRALEDYTVDGTITGALNEEQYVVFYSPNSFTLSIVDSTKSWDGTIEYSTDAKNWLTWDGTTAVQADEGLLYVRGTGNTYVTGSSASSSKRAWRLTGTDISISGNVETLLDYATVASGEHPTMAASAFRALFGHSAADLGTSITDISRLSLPADTLTDYCYRAMFQYCAIPATPKLPATTLATGCYRNMFYGCSLLTSIPTLPATTLAAQCYVSMFNSCTLVALSETQTEEYATEYRIPTSGTGTTATDALSLMFNNTGGTFTGTPEIDTTYYTSNEVKP